MKELSLEHNQGQKLSDTINTQLKKEFDIVVSSLTNKSIIEYGNEQNQETILVNIFSDCLPLEPEHFTLPQSLNANLKEERKSLPDFLNKITIQPEALTILLLETFKLKEPFFECSKFMQSVLKAIIEKTTADSNTKKIENINKFINDNIIHLNLLYKIHDLVCSIWSQQIEEATSINKELDILSENFEKLMNYASINIDNVEDIKGKLSDLILYSNEFCRRLKLNNSVLLDLQIYNLTIDNKNLPQNQIKELIISFSDNAQFFNEKLLPLLEQLIHNNENKCTIKLLELFYLKTMVNIEEENEETVQKSNDLQKEIIMFLLNQPELYFESIQLYHLIIKDMFILDDHIKENVQKIIFNNLHGSNICEKMDSQFLFIHILEKIFLSNISERKVSNFHDSYIKDMVEKSYCYIDKLNNEMKKISLKTLYNIKN